MRRPGTSLNSVQISKTGSFDQISRPVSQSGRPLTGFSRPSSSQSTDGNGNIRDVLQSSRRAGTARPLTTLGREVRLSTASLIGSSDGKLVNIEKLNVKSYASKAGLAMALVDYLLFVEQNTRKALDLCVEATKVNEFMDWWWKARLGKCYFRLGMFVFVCTDIVIIF
jgi:tetratricopeptide repeat protein 8